MKISDRTFIISGGSSGLGLATAQMILQSGGNVSILDRSPPPADIQAVSYPGLNPGVVSSSPQKVNDEAGKGKGKGKDLGPAASDKTRVIYLPTDVLKRDEIGYALEKTVEWTRVTRMPLGGVVNGAGIALAEMSISLAGTPHSSKVWDRVLGVNLNGTFNLTTLSLPHLVQVDPEGEDGERGVIIMISSSAAYEGQIGQIAYSASKGALLSMTLPLARDLARYGIRVVTLAPGPFTTPMTGQFSKRIERGLLETAMLYPKRYGVVKEFSDTVKWAIECSYINGENYRLSGGARVPAWL